MKKNQSSGFGPIVLMLIKLITLLYQFNALNTDQAFSVKKNYFVTWETYYSRCSEIEQ